MNFKLSKIFSVLTVFTAIFCLILLSVSRIYAVKYYVNNITGNDAYNGLSPDFAWQTLSKVNNRMNAEIWIYPNPAENFIKYIVNSADNTEIHVKVIDMMGRIIKEKTDNISKDVNEKSIDLSFLARGSYILQIVMENKKKIEKHFLIQ